MKGPTTGDSPAIVMCCDVTEPVAVSIPRVPPSVQPGQLESNVAETSNMGSAFAAPMLPVTRQMAASAALSFDFMSRSPLMTLQAATTPVNLAANPTQIVRHEPLLPGFPLAGIS